MRRVGQGLAAFAASLWAFALCVLGLQAHAWRSAAFVSTFLLLFSGRRAICFRRNLPRPLWCGRLAAPDTCCAALTRFSCAKVTSTEHLHIAHDVAALEPRGSVRGMRFMTIRSVLIACASSRAPRGRCRPGARREKRAPARAHVRNDSQLADSPVAGQKCLYSASITGVIGSTSRRRPSPCRTAVSTAGFADGIGQIDRDRIFLYMPAPLFCSRRGI